MQGTSFFFSFSFTLSLRFLPNGADFYRPNFPIHRTPWKGDLSLPWRSSKLTFWVSFLFGGKAPSLPRPMACLLLIKVKTFAPSQLLLPLLLGLEDSLIACPTSDSHSSPCMAVTPMMEEILWTRGKMTHFVPISTSSKKAKKAENTAMALIDYKDAYDEFPHTCIIDYSKR